MASPLLKYDRRRYLLIFFLVSSLILLQSSVAQSQIISPPVPLPFPGSGYGGVPVPQLCAPGTAVGPGGFPCIQPAPPDPTPNPYNPVGIPPIPAPAFPPIPTPPAGQLGRWTVVASENGSVQWSYTHPPCLSENDVPSTKTLGPGWIEGRTSVTNALIGAYGNANTPNYRPSFSFSFSPGCSPDGSPSGGNPPAPDSPPGGNPPAPDSPPGGNPPAPGGGGGSTPPSGGGAGGGGGGGGGSTPPPGQNPDKPQEYTQRKPNFIQYGFNQLKGRFPFDVFGDTKLPSGSDACPKFVFFDKTFELCIILDFIKILKIPCVISFIIWSIQSL